MLGESTKPQPVGLVMAKTKFVNSATAGRCSCAITYA